MDQKPDCICGTGRTYANCCAPYLLDKAFPPTAEALMRSRYTAYAVGAIPYIVSTVVSGRRNLYALREVESFSNNNEWLRLEIVEVVAGRAQDQEGIVEFRAWYKDGVKLQCLQERSRFIREDGHWRYLDGTYDGKGWRRRMGRNDPCPCGSGLKFKKCCS
jgi:SEC-C motif-containing protein